MDNSKQFRETSPDSFGAGIRAIFPMLLGTAPFGIVFGAFALDMGHLGQPELRTQGTGRV